MNGFSAFDPSDKRDGGAVDEGLVLAAAEGKTAAVDAILKKYIPLVGSRASVFTAGGLEFDDLFQEGMIGLYSAIRSYNAELGVPFAAFARLCIDRMLVAVLRSTSIKRRIPSDRITGLDDSGSAAQYAEDPESLVIARDDFNRFQQKVVSELSRLEYEVLTGFLSGLNYREIAARLGVTEKAVDNAMQRIRRKLKK